MCLTEEKDVVFSEKYQGRPPTLMHVHAKYARIQENGVTLIHLE